MGHVSSRKRPRPSRKQPLMEFEMADHPPGKGKPKPPKKPPKKRYG